MKKKVFIYKKHKIISYKLMSIFIVTFKYQLISLSNLLVFLYFIILICSTQITITWGGSSFNKISPN